LIKDFYEIRPLSLGAAEQVPGDASLVIVADPKRPITAAEAAAYDAYLRRGGRMLALVDVAAPSGDAAEGPLAPLLERWGLRPQDAIVIDPRGRTGDPDPRNVVGDAFPHPAMRAMAGQICLFPLARPIDFRTVLSDQQIFHAAIVAPGPDRDGQRKDPYVDEDLSLAEAPLEKVAALPLRGPQPTLIPLVISAYRKFEPAPGRAGAGTEARLVVAGDADFLSDRNFDLVGNREFALNLIRWLTGQELLIRREGERRVAKEAMSVSSAQMRLVWALGAGLPLAIFLTGWTVWFARRSK
jgi:ABC-type uncharacterized transport system involved in gliding motility auxiliary subunit